MLELLILPIALLLAFGGGVIGLDGWPARRQLTAGQFREGPRYINVAGETYFIGDSLKNIARDRVRVQFVVDSFLRAGNRDVVALMERAGYLEPAPFVVSRDTLVAQARQVTWGFELASGALLLVALAYWLLWTWLGARAHTRAS